MINNTKVDKKKIGLFGASQAGWVAPLAASMDKDISFLVIFSGGVVTTGEEMEYSRITGEMHDFFDKYSRDEIKEMEFKLPKSGYDPNPVLEALNIKSLWLFGDRDESIPITIISKQS